MDTEIEDRLEALDDTLAGHDDSIIALKKQMGALAQQVAKLMAFAAQTTARTGMASPIDEQALMLEARKNERAAQVTPAVKFGATTPYDAQPDRITGKRRELLGK
jgi:hypothetical protein